MTRIVVTLDRDERRALGELASSQLRDERSQVRFILRQELERRDATTPPALPEPGLLLSDRDRAELQELAGRLQLSQTQTVRVLVRERLARLKELDAGGGQGLRRFSRGQSQTSRQGDTELSPGLCD